MTELKMVYLKFALSNLKVINEAVDNIAGRSNGHCWTAVTALTEARDNLIKSDFHHEKAWEIMCHLGLVVVSPDQPAPIQEEINPLSLAEKEPEQEPSVSDLFRHNVKFFK